MNTLADRNPADAPTTASRSSLTPRLFGPRPRSRRPDILLLAAVLLTIGLLAWPSPVVEFDVWLRDQVEASQPDWALQVAWASTQIGLPTILALLGTYLAMWCAVWHGSIRPLLPAGIAWLVLGPMQQAQKLSDRVFPHWPDCPPSCPDTNVDTAGAAFFAGQGQDAFPSGHSISTIVWCALAAWLLNGLCRRWRYAIVIVPSALLTAGQTYMGYHWITDSLGGILIGTLLVRAIQRFPWKTVPLGPLNFLENLARRARARHYPDWS